MNVVGVGVGVAIGVGVGVGVGVDHKGQTTQKGQTRQTDRQTDKQTSKGRLEDRRISHSHMGKWQMEGGVAVEIAGKEYVAILYLTSPNDYNPRGQRQELHLIWCPEVPEVSGAKYGELWCSGVLVITISGVVLIVKV